MKVIRPNEVAVAMLISSDAVEAYADWSAATAYLVGNKVVRTTTNRIYERLVAGTTATAPESDPINWIDFGPTNKWAMFDAQTSTETTAANSLTVTVATGMIDSVALIGVTGITAQIILRDGLGGDVIYDSTQSFSGDIPTDWYQYFVFDPLTARTLGIFQDLPTYHSTHLTLVLSSGDAVAIGNMVFGLRSDIGETEYSPTAGIIDYSRKTTDEFGVTTFVKRAFSKRLTANLMIKKPQLNRVQRLLYGLRATPCVWIGSDISEFEEALVVYGFYRDFTTTISYPLLSYCSLEIEGLI